MARKAPTGSVVKRLFAKSGNRCAYKDCTNSLVDDDGNVLGEICHIEAASENGPRYNSNSDDEYRRSYENLVLLCERHHKIVDNNPEKYSAEFLRELKETHQTAYSETNFNASNTAIDEAIQKSNAYTFTINTNQGSGQQYILNADTINLDMNSDQQESNQPQKKSLKNRIDLITAILSIISIFLTILSRSTEILPNLNPHIFTLLILSTLLFMAFFGYISWSKIRKNEYKYTKKSRDISKLLFFVLPILSFGIWFSFLRLSETETKERDQFIALGNYYYFKDHLKKLALKPYQKALEIDPSQHEIIKRIKLLEE